MQKYIIVTGATFTNKGIQAMLYITADEIAKRWPDCQMLMYTRKTTAEVMNSYKFGFMEGMKSIIEPINPEKYHEIMSNTEALLDISGYSLSSDWSEKRNIYYIKT